MRGGRRRRYVNPKDVAVTCSGRWGPKRGYAVLGSGCGRERLRVCCARMPPGRARTLEARSRGLFRAHAPWKSPGNCGQCRLALRPPVPPVSEVQSPGYSDLRADSRRLGRVPAMLGAHIPVAAGKLQADRFPSWHEPQNARALVHVERAGEAGRGGCGSQRRKKVSLQ
jgi:hypothetical protein